MATLWSNGQWMIAREFAVTPTDRGLTQGLGLFETILVLEGRPIFADRHMARLQASCARLGWHLELPDVTTIMAELVVRNHLTVGRARIRVAITGGSGRIHELSLGADHTLWMTAAPAAIAPATTTVNLSPWVRNERSPLAGLKCASYADNLLAMEHAVRLGFEETVFLNTLGQLCESASANVFLVQGGQLFTPVLASGCLPGITRSVVIELAAQLSIPCKQATLTLSDLQAADECFLTSSIRGLMGVARFEQRNFSDAPFTRRLRDAWHATIQEVGS